MCLQEAWGQSLPPIPAHTLAVELLLPRPGRIPRALGCSLFEPKLAEGPRARWPKAQEVRGPQAGSDQHYLAHGQEALMPGLCPKAGHGLVGQDCGSAPPARVRANGLHGW